MSTSVAVSIIEPGLERALAGNGPDGLAEAGFQHAALEVARHHRFDHAAPATLLALEVVLVAAAEAVEVVRQEPEQR